MGNLREQTQQEVSRDTSKTRKNYFTFRTYSKELYIDLYDTSTTPNTNIIEELKLWKGIKSISINEGREKDDKAAATSTMMPA